MMEFIRKNPVLCYFVLTFVISWGGFILVVGGPSGFPGDPKKFETLLPFVAWAMLAGPSLSSLLLTGLLSRSAGIREIVIRLLKWRVSAVWYAFALLPAPILALAVQFALSQKSLIFTAVDKGTVITGGLIAGVSVVLEEIGWTGFAVPRLRKSYSVLTTGIIVGAVWGAWHFLQGLWISGTYAGGIPLSLYMPLSVLGGIAQLTAYRILLVWLYDRTGSLLVTTLMHSSLTTSTVFIFRPVVEGAGFLINSWLLTAALWAVVVSAFLGNRRQFTT